MRLTLSPDGSRIAILREGNLSVHEVSTGALVASVRLGADVLRSAHPFFESPSALTMSDGFLPRGAAKASLYRFDIAAKRLEEISEIGFPALTGAAYLRISPGRDRLLLRTSGTEILLFEPATGRRIAALTAPDCPARQFRAVFLSNGAVVSCQAAAGEVMVHLRSKDGVPERTIPVGKAMSFRVGAEVAPGRLTIALSPSDDVEMERSLRRIVIVDVSTGDVKAIGSGLDLAVFNEPWSILSDSPALTPGSLGTRLLRSKDGQLVVLDAASGRLTPFRPGGR